MYWRDVTWKWTLDTVDLRYYSEQPIHPPSFLIITHIFWDTFTSHGDKPSCIEETTYNLCFGDPLCRRLQKLVGNDKIFQEGDEWAFLSWGLGRGGYVGSSQARWA